MIELAKGKYIFGSVNVGERGQIVIPKEARDTFRIGAGDTLLIVGDERKGISIIRADAVRDYILKVLDDGEAPAVEAEKPGSARAGKKRGK